MFSLLSKYNRGIAWFFAIVLYLELIAVPLAAQAESALWFHGTYGLGHSKYVRTTMAPLGTNIDRSEVAIDNSKNFSPKVEKEIYSKKNTDQKFGTGPTQPEMQSFQSVNTNNMVDLFTGDFSYNIPLLDVGGYPVNIHYQSGITMDQESSWVGLGWNINPGTITRNMRGLPDDFKGDSDGVSKTVSMKPNITSGVALGGSGEFTGIPFLGLDASVSLFHNNYKGWGIETSVKPSINAAIGSKGSLTGSLSLSNNSQNGLDISPNMGVALGKQDAKTTGQISIGTNMNSRTGIQALQLTAQVRQHVNDQKKVRFELGTGISSYISFAQPSYTPTISIPFTSRQYAYKFKQGLAGSLFFTSGYVRGYQSSQVIDESDKTVLLPSYGYLYYEKANNSNSVLLDFNREKDIPYREKTPHIAVPIYTYDTYSISGEGTGGMFRPYRGDIGYVYDHAMATKSKSNDFTFENGGGNLFHGGAEVALVNAVTKSNPWLVDNFFKDAIGFKERDTSYENVYFKNPGEKGIADSAYLEMIGNDNLMRVDLSPLNAQSLPTITASRNFSLFKNGQLLQRKSLAASSISRSQRDKRTQVISYLTAGEASLVGLQKKIRSYALNSFPATSCNTNYTDFSRIDYNRKSYHVSEIDVLNPDGRKYVYGIPVYNLSQEDVAMATKSGDGSNSTGMTSYVAGVDNTIKNNNGKDAYYSREKLPPYSHSFLLTGILSSDYIDLTGDGITEDDMGDAIKFNYTQVYNSINPYKWRAPFEANQASYNEGLKTDNRDEKGSYTYGTREQWYLNSIESKTMIATFIIDTAGRYDSYGVTGENGGMDASQRLYRLKQINLYTKADYLKNGPANAKPVKTVHFEYTHELCSNLPNSSGNAGKLTLKKIWFSYNKNDKGKQNPYIFDYNKDTTNPVFNHKSYDRWGNYKDPTKNPGPATGAMTNMDYPYTLQIGDVSPSNNQWDSAQASIAVSSWTLSQIELPSGGKIKVSYESDDYAYVQNKRAMQFFSIIGFGNSSTAATGNYNLYSVAGDNNYIFIKVTDPAASKEEVLRKYLEGVSKLYFKVAVKMPNDKWGQGYEMVPCYADIISYGVIGNPSDKKIWIQVKPIKDNENPIATSAIQFLRLNLPSKAFPYSEPGDQLSVKSLIGMLASVSPNLIQTVKGYEAYARKKGLCKVVLAGQSFVRLNNPIYKKLGGGLRVKQVTIEDNWDVMTGAQMKKTTYGQQYDYTTTTMVNGVATKISSGVATYEPSLGNDENPFHIPFRLYTESEGIRAPTNYMYAEEPFAETFFPSPMVGYSKVAVQTINKTKKSAVGYEETEFFTSKEFPTIVEFTPLDNESKKTFNPKIQKLFRFNAKHFVTLSQGFKVELNDMNGKVKSQSTYAQNDLKNPISYTLNYYKLQNDLNGQKKLSSTVAAVDSISGRVKTNAEMGKEVEIMVDVREQVSSSISSSIELNIDVTSMGPLVIGIPSAIPVPASETNRYRSIAVLKIVNRYGILDSVIHMEKGSRVATRNLLYDGETGDVLVSQTNNEFDDPLYNFSYPAHWVNSGMGLAYKNIGATFKNMQLHQGKLFYANGRDTFSVIKHFESGDELLAIGQFTRNTTYAADTCQNSFYLFSGKLDTIPIWVIDAAKGYEKKSGLFFIDRLGKPVSGAIAYMKIIRSGKRNLASTQVGSVTTMQSPIKLVNSNFRLVLDSTLGVLGANAVRFVDFWKVDSTSFAKDTTIISSKMVDINPVTIVANGKYFSIKKLKPKKGSRRFYDEPSYLAFEASSYDKGNNNEDMERRSWVGFDFSGIPRGARIKSAVLSMTSKQGLPHLNNRNSTNSSYLERVKGRWIGDMVGSSIGDVKNRVMDQYFNTYGLGITDIANRITIPATPANVENSNSFNSSDISLLVQAMVDDYYEKQYDPALLIRLSTSSGDRNGSINRMAFQGTNAVTTEKFKSYPKLEIAYYMPCNDSSKAIYANYPVPGYYCYNTPKDSFVCRPNIVDTAVNPYRWGILGNWRVDRSYTYFDRRKDSDPLSTTNVRTNGEIKSFMPFWNFSSAMWQASQDSSRWVWNSQVTLFNKKGFEIENKDPLGRYNSGQYGYNQTLPVAVVQNSKNKVSMFDGFEDYDYRTDTCKKCPAPRFVDLTTGGGARVDTVSHTGKFSLRLNGNTTASVPIKVTGLIADSLTRLSIPVVTTTYTDTTIVPAGTGLNGYYSYNAGRSWLTPVIDPKIEFDWGTGAPRPGMPANWFDITWRGNVQPLFTDNYTFYLNSDDGSGLSIYLNNTWVSLIDQTLGDNRDGDGKADFGRKSKFTVQLQAGILYKIEVKLKERKERAKIKLAWSSSKETPHVIPQNQLYTENTTQGNVSGTIVTNTRTCVRMYTTKPSKVTNSLFTPEQGTKVVFSAWVKEAQPCITGSYANVSVQLSFNAGSPAQVTLVPKGNIIEGWQRIEDTVTIPATATSVSVVFKATSSTPVYFDDVRWHPYNSNMKSFVYSPINIRLMAELDENNYATFYEYDDDGTLIRVKKETERGIKTIKETRSALIKK